MKGGLFVDVFRVNIVYHDEISHQTPVLKSWEFKKGEPLSSL